RLQSPDAGRAAPPRHRAATPPEQPATRPRARAAFVGRAAAPAPQAAAASSPLPVGAAAGAGCANRSEAQAAQAGERRRCAGRERVVLGPAHYRRGAPAAEPVARWAAREEAAAGLRPPRPSGWEPCPL